MGNVDVMEKASSGTFFHSVEVYYRLDGLKKACSGTFFHSAEACYKLDGMEKLVLAHFSIAQKFISNAME